MLILEASNIKKYYGDKLIIEFEGLKIYSGDKIGIVGQNGSGKTTLMNILAMSIKPDEGFVKQFCSAAYIRQFADERIEAEKRIQKEFNIADKAHQSAFSGGEKARIKIANALSSEDMLLFADEPTANLDYKGIELLKQKLSLVDTFLLISHDRSLLDSLCNKIIEVRGGKLKIYNGNYSFYREQCNVEFGHELQEYEKYILERASLECAINDRQSRAKSMKKTPSRMGNSEARLHKRKTTEKQKKVNDAVNILKTRLEKLEIKEKPRELSKVKLDFTLTNAPENKIIIAAKDLSFSYGSKRILDNAGFKVLRGSKTVLWGENGTGKSTLLNIINNSLSKSIYIVPKAKIGYFYQGFENLDDSRSVFENIMRDSVQSQTVARTILARLLISGDSIYKNVGVLSGGEKIKVSFAKLFVSDANVLLLDEPTNYLDMDSIMALQDVLCDYEGTVLFVSHDREFVNAVANRLFIFENQTINEFEGNLKEYDISRKKAVIKDETKKIALQMRVTEVISRLSMPGVDKKALEDEYQNLISEISNL